MPRPSDLYANLGAPGMYQPTPWTPFVLPNVFLIPPVEDGRQVSCIFHSGSASSTAYDPFYGDPRYVPRNPTVTNVAVLDQALSLIQHQVSAAGRRHVLSSRRSGSPSYSSDQSSFERATTFPNVRFLIDNERHAGLQQDQVIPSRPASRRSSVFGERPYDHEISSECASDEEEEGVAKTMNKIDGMTLKERAASVFRSIGNAKIKRTENYRRSEEGGDEAVHRQNFLHFDQGSISSTGEKHHKRRTLGQLFGSNSSTNITVLPTEPPSAGRASPSIMSTNNPKLVKRKSMSQLFGFVKNSSADVFEMHVAPARWDQTSSLRPSSPPPKLSKRKSMTQLLGLGRRASPTAALAAIDSTSGLGQHDSHIAATDARLAALCALEGSPTSKPSRDLQSRNTSLRRSITAPSLAAVQQPPDMHDIPTSSSSSHKVLNRQSSRKSFLQGSTFSFLDPHRHFFHDRSSADQSSVQTPNSSTPSASSPPDPQSQDTTDSFYNPISTGSELDVEDVVPIYVPRLAVRSPTSPEFPSDGTEIVDLSSSIRLSGQKGDIAQWFDAHEPDGESEEEPSLELEMRLDSLSFDELSFDPDSFARTSQA